MFCPSHRLQFDRCPTYVRAQRLSRGARGDLACRYSLTGRPSCGRPVSVPQCSVAVEVTLHEEVSMNRRGQKVMSGGIAASMLVFAVASANAQAAARTGAWTYGAAEGEWVMTG